MMGERRDKNLFPRYGNGNLRLREMEPSRGLPPTSSRYRKERRNVLQKPNPQKLDLDPNLMSHLLFLINQNPRDLLRKLDELREHLSRSCEVSEKQRERPLLPASRRTLSSSSFGHHHNHLNTFSEVGSPRNHLSPHHLPSFNRWYAHGENGAQSFNDRYRRVRAPRDPYAQYSMRSGEHNACSSSYADSHHSFENNSYFAPAERLLLSSQDHDRRSMINAPVYSPLVESFKRRAKSCRPMNGASPFAVCDACFALLQLPAGFAFNSHKRKSQFKCGTCSKVFGLTLSKGKHNYNESLSIGSSRSWNRSSNNFSRERVYSKDVKPVSLSTSHDFERESGYGSSDIENSRRVTNERDYLEASSSTYEARDVSVNEVMEDTGDMNETYYPEASSGSYEARDVSVNEVLEDTGDNMNEMHYLEASSGTYEARDVSENEVLEDTRERNMVEGLQEDENKSCIEDVKKTVEFDQSADGPISGETLGVTSINEEMETKAEIGTSPEPVEMETKDGFEMSTEHAEDTSNVTVPNGSIGNREDIERSIEDVPVEVEKNSADTVALKGNTENKADVDNFNGDTDAAFEADSVNSHSIASSSYRESSRGSFEVRLDEEQGSVGKNGDSFLGGLVKRSFKELPLFNRTSERSKCRVWVNGRPISDRAVKRAEKKAGPIDPGDYWYDYRAGFWGVMGHQCLGIIPPFIKEFNYPMPQNCASGTTGVLVNGRELHQKDLTLLVGRGLPSIPGRSYTIEMSGKVVDEATGRELRNLGKLAPTIEILKRGFGMLVPQEVID